MCISFWWLLGQVVSLTFILHVHFVQILIEIFVTLFFEVSRFYFSAVAAMGALGGGVGVNFNL